MSRILSSFQVTIAGDLIEKEATTNPIMVLIAHASHPTYPRRLTYHLPDSNGRLLIAQSTMAAAPTSAHSAQHSHALPSVAAYYARAHRRQLESRAVVHALSFNSTATHLAAATDLNALTILSLSDALSDSSTSPRLAVHPFPSDALPTALLCATNSLYVATTSHCLHANWHALSQPHSSETPALIPIPGADDVIALAPLADGATLAASRRGPLLRLDSAARAQVAVASSSSEPTFDLVASPIDRHMIYKVRSFHPHPCRRPYHSSYSHHPANACISFAI